jgi:uncharacterized repeat protein (TIGR03803 family)
MENRLKAAASVFLLCAATGIASQAQTLKTLLSFDDTNGAFPYLMSVVQGLDGNLYGTTEEGGSNSQNAGSVFKITPAGTLTTLHSFCSERNASGYCSDGAYPQAGLLLIAGGNFYGTTSEGGASNAGTIFEITPAGKLTTIYNFCSRTACEDGDYPTAALILGSDGNYYGTTEHGGTGGCGGCHGGGTAFRLTPGGVLTTLHSFCTGTCTDGSYPLAGLVQGTDGNFYGTAVNGGAKSDGTVFKMTPSGAVTTLYSFCSLKNCTDGINPYAALVEGVNGNFYGTTDGDDSNDGTIFEITPAGGLTTLHTFCAQTNCPGGGVPLAPLVLASDGNFYGTTHTAFVDANCCGAIFKMTPAGQVSTLFTFDATNGNGPWGLFQATSGAFYGATYSGGTHNWGTVFSLSNGLGPFVETLPTFGAEGASVTILGPGLTGSSKVSFGGVAAKFTVVSSSEITTTVPAGAETGPVDVTTSSGVLKSDVIFKVTPQITSFTPTSGPVGTSVTIIGTELTQTTEVAFSSVKAASFKVGSASEVTAEVPSGAKTGKVTITTAGGTATSSETFTVTP